MPQSQGVNKANQTITFAALPSKAAGDAPFALTATASSGLAVGYASSNPAVATVAGSTVTIVGVGATTLTASQAGNANFNAATPVPQTQTVVAAPQTITFGPLAAKTFGDAPFALTATASSGLPVSYASSDTSVLTISGSTATIVGAGAATITAGQAGNASFAAAPSVPQSQGVNKAAATVVLGSLAGIYDGNPKPASATTTPGGLSVAFTYNSSSTPPTNPGTYAVVATITNPSYSGTASGTKTISIAVLVRHAPVVNGSLDGSVQMMLAEPASLSGSAWIAGDLLTPGTPSVVQTGTPTYGGTVDGTGAVTPTGYSVTLNDTSLLRHVVRRADPIALPIVGAPPAPVGTRNVSLTLPGGSAGDFATLRNLSLNANAGLIPVPAGTYGSFSASGNSGFVLGTAGATVPSVYNFQSLAINVLPGIAQIQVVGPIIINVANGSLMNGAVGASAHPEWLTLNVATGGLTISGNVRFNGRIVAPNSAVTLNLNAILFGSLVADRLTINGTSTLIDSSPPAAPVPPAESVEPEIP